MFLTTNRFETIDIAFKSRIHLAIFLPHLSTDGKRQLWRTSIVRACGDKPPRWLNRRFLDRAAEASVNGREIKNLVCMAHALARSGRRHIKAENIF